MLPAQAAKYDEVPSWLKPRLMGEDAKPKGPKQEVFPPELLQIADAILLDELNRGLEMDTASVTALFKSLISVYNEEADHFNRSSVEQHAERVVELQSKGILSPDEIDAIAKREPPSITLIAEDMSEKKLEHMVYGFCKKWGYARYKQERPSKHLSREHPSMKQLEAYIQQLKAEKKIHPRLMFNWDQVWTCFLVANQHEKDVLYLCEGY